MILLSSCVIFKKTLCSIFLWLAGGRELNNFFSSTAFNLRAVTNQHWLHQCNPFWSFAVWRQWISIPSEISAGAWGIQPGLSCLASCSHKPSAGAPVEAALLQHPRGEVWLQGIVSAGLLLHTAPDCRQQPLSLAEIMNYFHLEKKSSEELGLWDLCPKTRCAGVAVNYSATHRCFRHSDVALPWAEPEDF